MEKWLEKKGWSTNIQPSKHQESMHYDILGLAIERKPRNNKTSRLVNVLRCQCSNHQHILQIRRNI